MPSLFSKQRRLAAGRALFEQLRGAFGVDFSVRLWDGSVIPAATETGSRFELVVTDPGVLGSLLRRPTGENLLERYATGQLEIRGGSVVGFGDLLGGMKRSSKSKKIGKWRLLRAAFPLLLTRAPKAAIDRRFESDASGEDPGKRSNPDLIGFHYDLDNANKFFPLFLDPELLYSCAYYTDWGHALERAQLDKLELICRKLRLETGNTLLDVGCGWGALICYAAQHYGVRARGITLSRAQAEFVEEKIRKGGLEDRVSVEVLDYRDARGSYDRVVSVAMLEHVGVDNLQGYFDRLHDLLDDQGVLMVHGIANRAKREGWEGRRLSAEMRLAQKYLLPGLELADIGHVLSMMQISGFEIHDVEGLREHYERTSREWCERLYERREEAIALVGEQRYRLDSLCFAGMAWSFHSGSNSLYQVVASRRRRGASPLPPTRADLYRNA